MSGGPLAGLRVVEVGGQGPVPFAGMLLADLGAEVVRVDRVGDPTQPGPYDTMLRGRRSVAIDLKHPDGAALLLELVATADALLEGFRPGVMERLGLGPDECTARNPRLVYGRATGYGQDGPDAAKAGHDLNYVAVAGALAHFARPGEAPMSPLALAGDLAGGGMLLALGTVSALLAARVSGHGQVVDAAMVDGIALMMTVYWGMSHHGHYDQRAPGTHSFDLGSHFYNVYACADGEYISVAATEEKFYAALLRLTGLDGDPVFAERWEPTGWARQRARMQEVFLTRTRDEWCRAAEPEDVCIAPVLRMQEAAGHPHHVARQMFVDIGGVTQPAPAPRFSRTPAAIPLPPPLLGRDTTEVLAEIGVSPGRIAALVASGVVADGR